MVLINGKGGGIHDNGIVCNEPLSVINVEPGMTYRFRVVGGSAISFNTFGIEGHNDLELIEADGYALSLLLSPMCDNSLHFSKTNSLRK